MQSGFNRALMALVVVLILTSVAGCGQKGPLYHPEEEQKQG
jgi:predicted small lipoprotein YifL